MVHIAAGILFAFGIYLVLAEHQRDKEQKLNDDLRANRSAVDDDWREWAARQNPSGPMGLGRPMSEQALQRLRADSAWADHIRQQQSEDPDIWPNAALPQSPLLTQQLAGSMDSPAPEEPKH